MLKMQASALAPASKNTKFLSPITLTDSLNGKDVLEAWFDKNQEKVEFLLAPLDSKIYVTRSEEKEIQPEPIKRFNIYGDPQ